MSQNPYTNPEVARYLDYYEYWPHEETVASKQTQAKGMSGVLERAALLAPGLVLVAIITVLGYGLAKLVAQTERGGFGVPVSPVLLAIVLGLVLTNMVTLPKTYEAGLRWCSSYVLRLGIVLLGLRLSLSAIGMIGWTALPLVLACVATGVIVVQIAGRLLGLSPQLSCLIAVGTGICGVSAIVATAPAIGAKDDEVSYAAGCVALFGLLALIIYPWLSHTIFAGDPTQAGLFLGTAVHDTSQVTAASLLYSQWYDAPRALEVATVTKLLRNLCIVGLVPLLAVKFRKRGTVASPSWWRVVPGFIVMFVVMVILRTVGDQGEKAFGLLPSMWWEQLLDWSSQLTVICLALAMAAVGLGTRLSRLRQLGLRPIALGFVAAAIVGLVSMSLIRSGIIRP